jgi:hypothetical protein
MAFGQYGAVGFGPVQAPAAPPVHVAHQAGRRVVLASCLDDEFDDFEEKPFALGFEAKYLPAAVDLRRWMTPVESQGEIGSSTASALASALEYIVCRETGRAVEASRLFIYYNQRLWADRVRSDCGASIRAGIRVLARIGVPDERLWPYHWDLFAVQPPAQVYAAAAPNRITDHARVPIELDALRGALAAGFPVIFGTRIYSSFVGVGPHGVCPMPAPGEQEEGRHALLLVGYSDRERLFIVRNCWGSGYGHHGYLFMPYAYVAAPERTTDAWIVRSSPGTNFQIESMPDLTKLPKGPPGTAAPADKPLGWFGAILALARGKSPLEIVLKFAQQHATKMASSQAGGGTGQLIAGVVSGLTPIITGKSGVDGGVTIEDDRTDAILGELRGAAVAGAAARHSWDDGYDEAAVLEHAKPDAPAAPAAAAPVVAAARPTAVAATPVAAAPAAVAAAPAPAAAASSAARPRKRGEAAGTALMPAVGAAGSPARGGTQLMSAMPDLRASGSSGGSRGTQLMAAVPEPAGSSAEDQLEARWTALGGDAGRLGKRVGDVAALRDGVGRCLACERGAVIFHAERGAFEVIGAIFNAWLCAGAEKGLLGYPIGRETALERMDRRGRMSRFERGVIFDWDAAGADTPPFLLLEGDALFDHWLSAGAERASVGAPLGVAQSSLDGMKRYLPCERGAVVWSAEQGASELSDEALERWMRGGGA